MDESTSVKRCTRCGEAFPLTAEFWYRRTKPTPGFTSECKVCGTVRRRAYIAANPEKIHQQNTTPERQRRRREHQRTDEYRQYRRARRAIRGEQERKYQRAYYAANPEKGPASSRRWYAKVVATPGGRERIREYGRTWRLQNYDLYLRHAQAGKAKRRALKAQAGGQFTAAEWEAKVVAYGGRCHWCGHAVKGRPHADHLIPLSRGGTNFISNIVPSCGPCNLSKQAKLPHEWIARLL